jgi:hypothetical protein
MLDVVGDHDTSTDGLNDNVGLLEGCTDNDGLDDEDGSLDGFELGTEMGKFSFQQIIYPFTFRGAGEHSEFSL